MSNISGSGARTSAGLDLASNSRLLLYTILFIVTSPTINTSKISVRL